MLAVSLSGQAQFALSGTHMVDAFAAEIPGVWQLATKGYREYRCHAPHQCKATKAIAHVNMTLLGADEPEQKDNGYFGGDQSENEQYVRGKEGLDLLEIATVRQVPATYPFERIHLPGAETLHRCAQAIAAHHRNEDARCQMSDLSDKSACARNM